ncbi:SMP-30/gluconolactonase/LRE family protein [Nocardia mangyaensis]|uniref:SMP-30/gluconolactonase/LRE family protein n=1 Tax=Nocardia mangyaensis TaxID=2213200 RepID=UPI00267710B8|nr:SMP-30/gluconolactonase/LRE family protein [Nocardia mangyaensis]MDO3647965.1 SMP-30/gluconolactonase/LRE family protein [Nocardia mangyaensis]
MSSPRLLPLPGKGPEDVVLTPDGKVVTGTDDGAIWRIDPADGSVERIAQAGGRVLGMHADADGSLLICVAGQGVLRLAEAGAELEVIIGTIDGVPLAFPSNVVRDDDGTIYFSIASRRWPFEQWMADILEHSGSGQLVRRDPDGTLEVLVDGLQFGNGVVLAPDRSCLLVAETGAYRITRYWLTGPRAGTHDHLVENLPGSPDNMSLGSDGLVWVGMVAPRNPLLDRLFALPGLFRRLSWALPDRLQPAPERSTWVLALDFDGTVVHDLQRAGDNYAMVTSVAEHDGTLYLGSLSESAVAVTAVR